MQTTSFNEETGELKKTPFQTDFKRFQSQETKKKPLHKRQELMKMFVDRLNSERGKGYKALSPSFIASRMYQSGIKTDSDLWWFWGYLNEKFEQTTNPHYFSTRWWYCLSGKNAK